MDRANRPIEMARSDAIAVLAVVVMIRLCCGQRAPPPSRNHPIKCDSAARRGELRILPFGSTVASAGC